MIELQVTLEELKEIRRGLSLRSQEIEVYDDETEKQYDKINNLYDKVLEIEERFDD